jgi:hypothetical protein
MELVEITAQEYAALKPHLSPMVAKACDVYGYPSELIEQNILDGRYGIFLALGEYPRALCLVDILIDRKEKVANLFLVAGEGLTEWAHLIEGIGIKCKARGCSYLEGTGRPGWEKVMAPFGFTRVATTIRKPL